MTDLATRVHAIHRVQSGGHGGYPGGQGGAGVGPWWVGYQAVHEAVSGPGLTTGSGYRARPDYWLWVLPGPAWMQLGTPGPAWLQLGTPGPA